jgi:protein gp37
MERTPHLTYIIVTKRMKELHDFFLNNEDTDGTWPIPNVWLVPTVWDQESADRVIPLVLSTPAAVRGISYEPALGPLRMRREWLQPHEGWVTTIDGPGWDVDGTALDWVILGGETGPGARPMQPEWALDVYRQCKAAGVPFWFKQLGSGHRGPVLRSGDDWAVMVEARELPVVPR